MKSISPAPPYLLCSLFSSLLLACSAFGQNDDIGQPDPFGDETAEESDKSTRNRPVSRDALGDVPKASKTLLFDLEFHGLTAADACDYIVHQLEALGSDPLNIVVSDHAARIELPTMRLRRITFEQFVAFINRIGGGDSGGDPFSGEDHYLPFHSDQKFGLSNSDGIWYFWAEAPPAGKTEPSKGNAVAKRSTHIFPIEGEIESVLSLIEEALSGSKPHPQGGEPELKFHEPSQTLIVSAAEEELNLVNEVVSVMEQRYRQIKEADENSLATEMGREIHEMKQHFDFQRRIEEEEHAHRMELKNEDLARLQAHLDEARQLDAEMRKRVRELEAQLEKTVASGNSAE